MLFVKIFLYENFSYSKILEVYYVICLILATFAFY